MYLNLNPAPPQKPDGKKINSMSSLDEDLGGSGDLSPQDSMISDITRNTNQQKRNNIL